MSELTKMIRAARKRKEMLEQMPQRVARAEERLAHIAAQLESMGRAAAAFAEDFAAQRREAEAEAQQRLCRLERELSAIKQTVNLCAAGRLAGKKIKVVFLVHHIEAWDSIGDIYEIMRDSADFVPTVISIKRHFPGDKGFGFEEVVDKKLTEQNVPHLRFAMENSYEGLDILKALAPDIIFKQSQWDADVPPAFASDELRFARLCYVPYFVGAPVQMEVLNKGHDIEIDSPLHRFAWKIFYPTEDQKSRFKKYAVRQGDNLEIVGHPKVRRLQRVGAEKPVWPIEQAGPRRFRLIWAPHHSIDKNWLNFGMFPAVYRQMLDWARTDDSIEIVLYPHPATLARVREGRDGVSAEECADFLRDWDSLPNTARWSGGNYAGLMQASDCLISDGISFLAEYQFFAKPVIFLERPDHLPFSAAGKRIVQGVHSVADVAQARDLARQFAAGRPDDRAQAQRENTAWLAGDKLAGGSAAERIVASIRRGLRD